MSNPLPPDNLSLTPEDSAIVVNWKNAEDAEFYNVYYKLVQCICGKPVFYNITIHIVHRAPGERCLFGAWFCVNIFGNRRTKINIIRYKASSESEFKLAKEKQAGTSFRVSGLTNDV